MKKRKSSAKHGSKAKDGNATVQQSSFYINAARTQRAVVIYTDQWTYTLDNNNNVVAPPAPQMNAYTDFCQRLLNQGYVLGPPWNLPANPPPRG